jgi:hypothetical protein
VDLRDQQPDRLVALKYKQLRNQLEINSRNFSNILESSIAIKEIRGNQQ